MSTSDYIKNELLLLQRDLRPLEERAVAVEKEIREAMSMGKRKGNCCDMLYKYSMISSE